MSDDSFYQDAVTDAYQLRAENNLIAERDKLRAALEGLYREFSKSNDFRSDSRQARNARAALNEETK